MTFKVENKCATDRRDTFIIMKQNENIKIIGKHVVLIPYEEHHVDKYNATKLLSSSNRKNTQTTHIDVYFVGITDG